MARVVEGLEARVAVVLDGDVTSDVTLADAMFREQSLHVLPGQCFGIDNFFRVVLCPDTDSMKDVCSRIDEFCKKHKK